MVHGLTPARKAEPSAAPIPTPPIPAPSIAPFLIGHGYDLHRIEPATTNKKLILAGVVASEELGAISHSDGDVIFHALVDAMLGALGQGDIGQLFPNTDPRWKDAPSRLFVEEAMRRVRQAGYRVGNVDITLLLEKPKIGPLRQQMLDSLRSLLGGAAIVNLKAGTNEGCDAIGRGEAVAAHAVVLLAAAT